MKKAEGLKVSINAEELTEVITTYLQKKGYGVVNIDYPIKIIRVEVVKLDQNASQVINSPANQVYFSDEFIERINPMAKGLSVYIKNVDVENIQKVFNVAFAELEEIDRNILHYAFNLDTTGFRNRKMEEIEKKFRIRDASAKLYSVLPGFSKRLFELFNLALKEDALTASKSLTKKKILREPIKQAGLSKSTRNCLMRSEIHYVSDLLKIEDYSSLRKVRLFGSVSEQEIEIFKALYYKANK